MRAAPRIAGRLAALMLFAAGCANAPQADPHAGPVAAAPVRAEPWAFEGKAGKLYVTPHYWVFSTIEGDDVGLALAQVMEGARDQYLRVMPSAVPAADRPMQCYVFQYRNEWAAYTKQNAGADATVYLQISRGGYTVGDVFVSYFIGDGATYSVAAHEGWHQFVSRHCKQRVPPFMEEGLACWFEAVRWDPVWRLPRWDVAHNNNRLRGLREAIEEDRLIPLPQLAVMHAGQIVSQPFARIEGFYAQNWGFARFLWEGENGRYRPALQQMMADSVAGRLYPPSTADAAEAGEVEQPDVPPVPGGIGANWDPAAARPMLERYLGTDLETLDAQYRKYLRKIAFTGVSPRRMGPG
jgi:hypothetical protein